MKIIGIIPSRFASTRFPGKPLIDIHGKSMIRRVYEQCLKSELDQVWVATDDERIKDEVIAFGGNAVMTSAAIKNGSERCRKAFEEIGEDASAFVNIQGDEPLIRPESINLLIHLMQKPDVLIGTLIRKEQDEDEIVDPNRVKVVVDKEKKALMFSRSVIPFPRTKPKNLIRYVHVGIYGFKKEIIAELNSLSVTPEEETEQLEQISWLVNGYSVHTAITEESGHSIDNPEDYEYVLNNWENLSVE